VDPPENQGGQNIGYEGKMGGEERNGISNFRSRRPRWCLGEKGKKKKGKDRRIELTEVPEKYNGGGKNKTRARAGAATLW